MGRACLEDEESSKPEVYIERMGPDVPIAYESTNLLIVTDEVKEKIEQSNLFGFCFIEVIKKKIIQE